MGRRLRPPSSPGVLCTASKHGCRERRLRATGVSRAPPPRPRGLVGLSPPGPALTLIASRPVPTLALSAETPAANSSSAIKPTHEVKLTSRAADVRKVFSLAEGGKMLLGRASSSKGARGGLSDGVRTSISRHLSSQTSFEADYCPGARSAADFVPRHEQGARRAPRPQRHRTSPRPPRERLAARLTLCPLLLRLRSMSSTSVSARRRAPLFDGFT